MPQFTYADNWTSAHSTFASSYYKTNMTLADQIIAQLDRIVEDDDYHVNPQAEVLRKAFGYEDLKNISELHVIKLILNEKGILSLKIAASHPVSADICSVGTFTLDHALNIHSLDKLETIERKIPRLLLPKIKFAIPTVTNNQDEKENTAPNILVKPKPVEKLPFFMKQASASHAKLPVDDKLLELLLAATLAEDEPDTSRKPHH